MNRVVLLTISIVVLVAFAALTAFATGSPDVAVCLIMEAAGFGWLGWAFLA